MKWDKRLPYVPILTDPFAKTAPDVTKEDNVGVRELLVAEDEPMSLLQIGEYLAEPSRKHLSGLFDSFRCGNICSRAFLDWRDNLLISFRCVLKLEMISHLSHESCFIFTSHLR